MAGGRAVSTQNFFVLTEITCHAGGTIDIGARVTINYGVILSARKNIVIGNDVLIGNFSIICDSKFPLSLGQRSLDGDFSRRRSRSATRSSGQQHQVTLLPGVKTGRGAVIAAGVPSSQGPYRPAEHRHGSASQNR